MAHHQDGQSSAERLRTDEELMRTYQNGDEQAFRALFGRYAGRIYAYLLHFTGSKPLAEDLTQQTWLHLHRARATFMDGARFAPWLYTIAANLGRDSARARGRSGESLTADGTLPESTSPDAGAHADEVLDLDARGQAVRQALQALPPSYREVILLHRWHDLGFAEIATALGTTEGAVKLRAHRGYVKLRELLLHKGLS